MNVNVYTSTLIGPALNYMVAKCLWPTKEYPGWWFKDHPDGCYLWEALDGGDSSVAAFSPSTQWSQGGVIIDQEKLDIHAPRPSWPHWKAYKPSWTSGSIEESFVQYGPTALVAAMRCYITSKLGNSVEIPEELYQEMEKSSWDGEISAADLTVETYAVQQSGFIMRPANGVRIIHIPTGLKVECYEERSQHRNRQIAYDKLVKMLQQM